MARRAGALARWRAGALARSVCMLLAFGLHSRFLRLRSRWPHFLTRRAALPAFEGSVIPPGPRSSGPRGSTRRMHSQRRSLTKLCQLDSCSHVRFSSRFNRPTSRLHATKPNCVRRASRWPQPRSCSEAVGLPVALVENRSGELVSRSWRVSCAARGSVKTELRRAQCERIGSATGSGRRVRALVAFQQW